MADYNILDYKNGEAIIGTTVAYDAQPILGSDEIDHNSKTYVVRNVRHRPDADSVTPDVELICYEKSINNINYTVSISADTICETTPFVLEMVAPLSTDYDYPVPTIWINTVTNTAFILTDVTSEVATWEAMSGGGGSSLASIYLPAEAAYLPATNPATLSEVSGSTTYAGWSYLAFDASTSEHAVWRTPLPDYDGGDIVVTSYTKPATTPSGPVTLQFNILAIGLSTSEVFNSASPVDTLVNLSQSMDTTELDSDVMITTATIDPSNVSADDLLVIGLSRDVADSLVGDGQLLGIMLEYTRTV